jgi:hypothetical protein
VWLLRFLGSPTLIGFVAQLTSLRVSLSILVLLGLLGIALSSSLRPQRDLAASDEAAVTAAGSVPL